MANEQKAIADTISSARYRTTEQRYAVSSVFVGTAHEEFPEEDELREKLDVLKEREELMKKVQPQLELLMARDCDKMFERELATLKRCVVEDSRVYDDDDQPNNEFVLDTIQDIHDQVKVIWSLMPNEERAFCACITEHPFMEISLQYIAQDVCNLITQYENPQMDLETPAETCIDILWSLLFNKLPDLLWYAQTQIRNMEEEIVVPHGKACDLWHELFPDTRFVSHEQFVTAILRHSFGAMDRSHEGASASSDTFKAAARLLASHYRYDSESYEGLSDHEKVASNVLTNCVWVLDSDGDGIITLLDFVHACSDSCCDVTADPEHIVNILFTLPTKSPFEFGVCIDGDQINIVRDVDVLPQDLSSENYIINDSVDGWLQVIKIDHERKHREAGIVAQHQLNDFLQEQGLFRSPTKVQAFKAHFSNAKLLFKCILNSLRK